MTNEKNQAVSGPHVMIFAGPNGSGKTSLIDEVRETGLRTTQEIYHFPTVFINPDQVAKEMHGIFVDQDERDMAAAKASLSMRTEAVQSKQAFAFETVMSHPSRLSEMLSLKEQGYKIFLTFITTDDPEKNVARVTQRYENGTTTGHYVAPDKVRDRYERTLALLPRAVEIADAVYIYDNSVDFQKPVLQAAIGREQDFLLNPNVKDWVLEKVIEPLNQRELELSQLEAMVSKAGHAVGESDELRGHYEGEVLFETQNFIVQLDRFTDCAVVHDRLLLDVARKVNSSNLDGYKINDVLTITYTPTNAPTMENLGPSSLENCDQANIQSGFAVLSIDDMTTRAFLDLGRNTELESVLTHAADKLRQGTHPPFPLEDTNGNNIGRFEIVSTPPFEMPEQGTSRLQIDLNQQELNGYCPDKLAKVIETAGAQIAASTDSNRLTVVTPEGKTLGTMEVNSQPVLAPATNESDKTTTFDY